MAFEVSEGDDWKETGTLRCTIGPTGYFSCQDPCGVNTGNLEISVDGRLVLLYFDKICSRDKHKTLEFRVDLLAKDRMLLERDKNRQEWIRMR